LALIDIAAHLGYQIGQKKQFWGREYETFNSEKPKTANAS